MATEVHMRVRHLVVLLAAFTLSGCGGCSGCGGSSSDPRDADDGDKKAPAEDLTGRLRTATTDVKGSDLSPDLRAAFDDDSHHVRRAAIATVRRNAGDKK